mgnify:CR=1 FL=1
MQLLPDHNLKKHPYTYNYSQITTSENTHIHTTTPRSQHQKTPIYKQILPYHNLKKHPYTCNYSQITTSKNTHIQTNTTRSQPQKTPIYIQLLPDHNLKKHPYTNKYYHITTSKNAHIHTTTLRTRPQKTPIYTLLLSEHDLKNTHIHTTTPDHDLKRYTVEEYKHKKVGINHHSVYPHLYYFSRLITKTNQKVRCFTLRKQQPNG